MEKFATVAVGGLGGSGTRVVAMVLKEAGYYIGGDLNPPLDNLWFALLYKQREVFELSDEEFKTRLEIFEAVMSGSRPLMPDEQSLLQTLASEPRFNLTPYWLGVRVETMMKQTTLSEPRQKWGWKTPHTHTVLDRLNVFRPQIKYIHVMRNGLDMPYARNQSQITFWGDLVLGQECATPRMALKYWRWAQERVLGIGRTMGDRFLLVRFEELCASPMTEVKRILSFIDGDMDSTFINSLVEQIQSPKTIGRHKEHPDEFDPEDVEFVRSMGFDV